MVVSDIGEFPDSQKERVPRQEFEEICAFVLECVEIMLHRSVVVGTAALLTLWEMSAAARKSVKA